MIEILKYAGVALLIFLFIDGLWLGFFAKKFYKNKLGHLMKEKPNFISAVIFYLIYILALSFFVIQPAVSGQGLWYAIFAGAFFGLASYATYDLTNLATMKNFPVQVAIIDLVWGTFVTSLLAVLTYLIFI